MDRTKKENVCRCLDSIILILLSAADILGCILLPKIYRLGAEIFDGIVAALYAAQLFLLLETLRVKSRDRRAEKGALKALEIITSYVCFFTVALMTNVDIYLFFSGITAG